MIFSLVNGSIIGSRIFQIVQIVKRNVPLPTDLCMKSTSIDAIVYMLLYTNAREIYFLFF